MKTSINYLNYRYDNFGNKIYSFSNIKPFHSMGVINDEYRKESFRFAYRMSFSDEGYHRNYRSGGSHRRKKVEVFCNTFIGKLGEFAVYQYLTKNGNFKFPYPDLTVMGKGLWDSYDFTFYERKIGVKTTKPIGNLLLLERKDWNEYGQYIPDLKKGGGEYTDFIFVRVDIDIESNLRRKRLFYSDFIDTGVLKFEYENASYQFDLLYVPIGLIRFAIQQGAIIEKGSYLNKTLIDADNYYIQSGDMLDIKYLIHELDWKEIINNLFE